MSKRVKEMVIEDLRARIGDHSEMLVIDSSRLDAVGDNRFRLALQEKKMRLLTVKNSLAKRALNQAGISALDPILQGPSSLVWGSEDIVTLSKEIAKWAKEIEQIEIKGGTAEGKSLSADDVHVLSKSPGRVELIGRIVMLALSPGAQLAGALLGPGGKLSGQVEAIADRDKGEE